MLFNCMCYAFLLDFIASLSYFVALFLADAGRWLAELFFISIGPLLYLFNFLFYLFFFL